MTCTPIKMPDGSTAILCERGRRGRQCSEPGCSRPAVVLCDYPLSGRKASRTCSRALCEGHRRQQQRFADTAHDDSDSVDYCPVIRQAMRDDSDGDTVDYCPAHDRAVRGHCQPHPTLER